MALHPTRTVVTSDCCQKLKSQGIWFRNRLLNATKCAAMVEVAKKTGKLQGYRFQFTYNFIKFLRNSSPTTPPPPPLHHYHRHTTTTTNKDDDDDDDNNKSQSVSALLF